MCTTSAVRSSPRLVSRLIIRNLIRFSCVNWKRAEWKERETEKWATMSWVKKVTNIVHAALLCCCKAKRDEIDRIYEAVRGALALSEAHLQPDHPRRSNLRPYDRSRRVNTSRILRIRPMMFNCEWATHSAAHESKNMYLGRVVELDV